jgi:hypothetical protein
LFYLTRLGQVMAVEIEAGATFLAKAPRELFRASFTSRSNILLEYREFAPTADGQRFVISAQKERRMSLVTLVTNWAATIGARP